MAAGRGTDDMSGAMRHGTLATWIETLQSDQEPTRVGQAHNVGFSNETPAHSQVVLYWPVADLNLTTSSAGTRPRSLTSMSWDLAHSRTAVGSGPPTLARLRLVRPGRRAAAPRSIPDIMFRLPASVGARWGAIIGRHGAIQGLAPLVERSKYASELPSSHG